jgi:hypothetical protein
VSLLSASVRRAPLQRGPVRDASESGRPMGRLRCDARRRVAPQNSLRAPRALRSDNCGESVLKARCARRPRPCASRRSQWHPEQTPAAAAKCGGCPAFCTACGCFSRRSTFSSADGGGVGRACGSPRSAGGEARARSALCQQIRGSCLSVANAVSEASSAAGPCTRAPQGSRPRGPTDTPKRPSPPPSAERGNVRAGRPVLALTDRDPITH